MSNSSTTTGYARPDRRALTQSRPIKITYEGLDRVDGSARFSFGSTSALASVSGPLEVRPLSELPARATLDVLVRPLAGLPGPAAKALAASLKSIFAPALYLAKYPRSLVQLVVQATAPARQGSGRAGGVFGGAQGAAAVNAAMAAFLCAGAVGVRAVVCAVAVRRVEDPGAEGGVALVLDPSEEEEGAGVGGGTWVVSWELGRARVVWTDYGARVALAGKVIPIREGEMERAREMAVVGAREVWEALKESVGSMDGTRGVFVKGKEEKRGRREEAQTSTLQDTAGQGEFDDEMEEVDEAGDDRIEI